MSIIQWAESRSRALTIWDTGLLKSFCILFGMVLGAYAASFVLSHLWWFTIAILILGGAYGFRWFTVSTKSR